VVLSLKGGRVGKWTGLRKKLNLLTDEDRVKCIYKQMGI
jgi:hypothetical protein